ncbi:MAG: BON domain-containing protein [Kiritimatiellae bacterium]|nr:BON domain-containing protein [Kiritimatiellia bacterium]
MNRTNWWTAAVAAVAMAGLAGCATLGEQLGAAPLTEDERVAAEAMQVIQRDGLLGGGAVTVEVFRGTATVSGVVDSNMARLRVLDIVDNTDGVFRVEDRLQVR